MYFVSIRSITSKFALIICSLAIIIFSCKKNNGSNPNTGSGGGTGVKTTGTVNLNDTVFNFAKFFYYWNEKIPNSFNYNGYSLYIAAADSSPLVQAITLFSPLNTVNNLHYDHFSFLLTETQYNQIFNGAGGNSSFSMQFGQDRNGFFRVSYLPHSSDAYSKGVRRGWELDAVNGISLTSNVTSSVISQVNNIFSTASSASFTFTTPNSANPVTLNISAGSYNDDEVIATTAVQSGSQVIGYISYNTFVCALDKNNYPSHPGMDTAFAYLKGKGVTDLIIDLRYNGGGYNEVSEDMVNALVPSSANGHAMYTQLWSDSTNLYHKAYPKEGWPDDTTIFINKSKSYNPSSLNINNIVFIVSKNTVSASEQTINNLLPYFPNLKLVGLGKSFPSNQQNTGGKPYGFFNYSFPLPKASAVPEYELFMINFESKNALNQDNFISGFVPDVQEYDGVEYNWGDPNEDGYKAAFNYLTKGTFSLGNTNNTLGFGKKSVNTGGSISNFLKLNASGVRFKGMVWPFRSIFKNNALRNPQSFKSSHKNSGKTL